MNDIDLIPPHGGTDAPNSVEVTPEMIAAGARVLMEDDYLSELMCEAYAEDYAEKIIRRALSAGRRETS